MPTRESIKNVVRRLSSYIESQDFQGYDPYDALNSSLPFHLLGRYGQSIAIQILKRNPVNLRPLLGIRKDRNPKAIGLLLEAYSRLFLSEKRLEYRIQAENLFSWLLDHTAKGFSGNCWGYNFVWANPKRVLNAYHPSIVVTSFVGKGIFEFYRATMNPEAKRALRSICDYILKDLPLIESKEGICFSYTDIKSDCCYNASLLGAEILAKTFSLTGEPELRERALRAADFVVAKQHPDGHWNYSLHQDGIGEREQVDFHQGFVLTSLWELLQACGVKEEKYFNSLKIGLKFYRQQQFSADGRSKWRLPKSYPVDIHHQAQGIVTFTVLRQLDKTALEFARSIAEWSISHLWDNKGYFYYRWYPFFINKIPYMRWSQAWMLLALSHLMAAGKEQ